MKKLLDPKNPAARWELIKAALRARGSSLSAVARDLGLTREAVHHVHRNRYPAVEAAIASVLEVSPADLWPDRYHADGRPVRQRPNAPMARPTFRRKEKVKANFSIAISDEEPGA
ncbi:helix-turn-helix domain-containing protein [Thiocystis violascens]|uniref:Transcriptional regulator, Nlp family n=1 Tax=Thiocystis violascens (strain ATCC 17096 / DSM 198 / 6111) TaxID=765911 RepID=I3YEF3_THIV6|nr:helix-turn-helix domain-containing protein [Thiocystis violascens]AFL75371.1 transcriptional regulator, Nlp family [Thiocystis violascens DSM 198]